MKDKKWVKLVERKSDYWKNHMMTLSISDVEDVFGFKIEERLTTRRGMIFTHWLNPQAVWNCSLEIEKELVRDPRLIPSIYRIFKKAQARLFRVVQKIEKTEWKNVSTAELKPLYLQFCKMYKELYPAFHLTVYLDSIESKAKAWLQEKLQSESRSNRFSEYFSRLCAWPELNLLQQEEISLMKLALTFKGKKRSRKPEHLLNKHILKYAGIPVIHDGVKPWGADYFLERSRAFQCLPIRTLQKKIKAGIGYSKIIKNDRSLVSRQLGMPETVGAFFKLVALATWIRLEARSSFALSHHASKGLFSEIGRRTGHSGAEVKWLDPAETIELINTGRFPARRLLADRKRAVAFIFCRGAYKILTGKEAEEFIRMEIEAEPSGGLQIRGVAAHSGKARGVVRVILSQKDIRKMKSGDILVTRMTTTEIMPAARLAGGIITDEGGITCHAAIISRELNVPCTVGTKIATRVLKDGDQVSFDEKGLVKVVRKVSERCP